MELTRKYNKWIKTLFLHNEKRIFIWLGPAGLGDKISCLPAFRHLKKIFPDRKVVLYVESLSIDIWKSCRYIDYIIPEDCVINPDSLYIRKDFDLANKAWWSFFDHHQKHICKSNVEYICNTTYTDDIPLEYELDIWESDLELINREIDNLKEKSKGLPIIGISPTYTMYSRMWSKESWRKLKNLLVDAGYFVVALGGNNDLDVATIETGYEGFNFIDMRNKIPVRMVPRILDYFTNVITLNSGMLHLASVNQNVPITYLNVGQFPAELIVPYRKGKLFHNVKVIEHNCPTKKECFEGHITESIIRPMMFEFLNTYKKENNVEFPEERIDLMKKYVCWHYCLRLMNKYECSKLITPEMVMEKL